MIINLQLFGSRGASSGRGGVSAMRNQMINYINENGSIPRSINVVTTEQREAAFSGIARAYNMNADEQRAYEATRLSDGVLTAPLAGQLNVEGLSMEAIEGARRWMAVRSVRRGF